MKNPTIKDVAKRANVSIATVSRILNKQKGYSKETKAKVMQVIEEMGYHPNRIARGLVKQKTNIIAVLLPEFASSFSTKVLKGIEAVTHEKGYSIIVCNTGAFGGRTMEYIQVLREQKIDGLILTSLQLNEEQYEAIQALKIPIILISSISHNFPIPFVKVDDERASYDATNYLIKKGHRKIAMIGGPMEDQVTGFPRYEGFQKAHLDNQLKFDKRLIVEGDFSFKSGKEAMRRLLQSNQTFTALFAASDDMAIGALSIAYEQNIKVPDQLSIIGYDDSHIAEMSIPPLTTVAQPLELMGRRAASRLIQMMEGKKTVSSLMMSHQIIERNTVQTFNCYGSGNEPI